MSTTETAPLDLAACRADVDRAHTEVGEICQRTGPGRWRMSIPAQPNRDSDLLISAGLTRGERLADEVERLRAALTERTAALGDALRRAEHSEGEHAVTRERLTTAEVTIAGVRADAEQQQRETTPARGDRWRLGVYAQASRTIRILNRTMGGGT